MRFRFTMRALLAAMILIAVSIGYVSGRARRQAAAAQAIEALGGRLVYNWEVDPGNPSRQPPSEHFMRRFLGPHYFDTVVGVDLPRINAGVVKPLSNLVDLKYLYLDESQCTDNELALLPDLPRLQGVSLINTQVTDRCIPTLCRFRNLNCVMAPKNWTTG